MLTILFSSLLATATLSAGGPPAPAKAGQAQRGHHGICKKLSCTDAQREQIKSIRKQIA